MNYHILNGDALAEKFPSDLGGKMIVIREVFMDGPVDNHYNETYWLRRADFISQTFNAGTDEYAAKFRSQLELLDDVKNGDEVCLWFEDDLFCQVNMWFTVNYLMSRVQPEFYRVFPEPDDRLWKGFGEAEEKELRNLYHRRQSFTSNDSALGVQLWNAYVSGDQKELKQLALRETRAMRFLPVVIEAHLARLHPDESERQPHKVLREIIHEGNKSFEDIFAAFSRRAGIYGYGDLQIKNILSGLDTRSREESV